MHLQTQQTLASDWQISSGRRANIRELRRSSAPRQRDRNAASRCGRRGTGKDRTPRKEKRFDVNQATAALAAVRDIDSNQHGYREHTPRKPPPKTAASCSNYRRERGELAPVAELREGAYQLVKAYTSASALRADARSRLFTAKTATELERLIATDFESLFADLKRDYPQIL